MKRQFLFGSLRIISVALLIASVSGCKRVSTSSSSSTGSWGNPPPAATVYPLELTITSTYEAGGPTTTEANCNIPIGSPAGTVVACTNAVGAVSSAVAIPEARLYFSDLTFTINAGTASVANGCEILFIQPFSYRASTSASFSPPWLPSGSQPIDCSTANPSKHCFGGVGVDAVPNFPNYRSFYYMTALSLSATFSAKSANSHQWGSNRWATNNLVTKTAAHTWKNGDAYVANSYNDYDFVCVDRWWQPVYEITLKLTDVDITGIFPNASQNNATINQRADWDILSWDY